MKEFDYLAPKSLKSVLRVIDGKTRDYKLLAGGTSLVPDLVEGKITSRAVVDLNGIKSLHYIKADKEQIKIGSLVTISEILDSKLIRENVPILWKAASKFGGPLIRNRATVGGNLVNASPAADMAIPLLALKADLKLLSSRGIRTLPINKFFTGYRKTAIKEGEILTEVAFYLPSPEVKQGYCKLGLWNSMAISVVSVGVVLQMNGESCIDAGLSLGAVAPIPFRADKAEVILKGRKITPELAEECGKIAAGNVNPIDDIRASLKYRRQMCEALTRRVICQSLGLETKN